MTFQTFFSLCLMLWVPSYYAGPVPPSQDIWYKPPLNITAYAPGDLIRSRQIPNQLQPFIHFPVEVSVESVYQYSFRTTDSLGNAVMAVTTLMIPFNSDPKKLLSYQTAYDSANPDCSPSFTLQAGSSSNGLAGMLLPNSSFAIDTPFLAAALNQGWWVTTTDYEGLQAHFSDGLESGFSTLDSIRVVLREGTKLGLADDARYALWGFSGGSIACGWAAELQPTYAPELRLAGAAIGDTIANVSNVFTSISGTSSSGLAFGAVNGLSKAYSNFSQWLDQNLVPAKKQKFFELGTSCLIGEESLGAHQDLYSYFINGKEAIYDPIPASILRLTGDLGEHGVPQAPIYMYKAVHDRVSPTIDTDELVSKYCDEGATISYYRSFIGSHASESIVGSFNAFGWIADRLDGKPVSHPGSCITRDVLLAKIDDRSFSMIGKEMKALLISIFGGMLGK